MHVVVWRCLQERLLAAAMVDDETLYLHSSDRPLTFHHPRVIIQHLQGADYCFVIRFSDVVEYICRSRKPQKCYPVKILSQVGDGGDMEMMYEEAIYIIVEVDISCS